MAGFGVAHARNGSPFLASRSSAGEHFERAETVVELSYRFQLSDLFHVQPNLQWVIRPGTDPNVEDSLVFGLRGMVTAELP